MTRDFYSFQSVQVELQEAFNLWILASWLTQRLRFGECLETNNITEYLLNSLKEKKRISAY